MKVLILWLLIIAASVGTYALSHKLELGANAAAVFFATGERHELALYADRVEPSQILVRKGEEVVFVVKGDRAHDISEERSQRREARLDSGEIGKGESYSLIFAGAGTFYFYDRMNQDIRATITVR